MKSPLRNLAFLFVLPTIFTVLSCSSLAEVGSVGASVAGAFGVIDDDLARGVSAGLKSYAEKKRAAENLTPENEYYIGRAVAANLITQYKGVYNGNPALTAYLNRICSAITINSPKPEIWNGYHVAILDTQEINAFATSGGHIFLTRGLIACTSSEDALASVIAHEVAHIQLQHSLLAIQNSRFWNAVTSGVVTGVSVGVGGENLKELAGMMGDSAGEIVTTMVSSGYAKDQEFEADTLALALLASAGYEPSSILEMLHSLEQKQTAGSGFGKTHPSPADRIANVNKSLRKYSVADTTSFRKQRYTAVMPR
jgi:predicted Zn-dependent protease